MQNIINFVVPGLLGTAVIFDLWKEKVPNLLVLTGYGAACLTLIRAPTDALLLLMGIAWPIVFLYPLYLARGLGAGDIKLFSVLGAFFHYEPVLWMMLYSLMFAAAISIDRLVRNCILQDENKAGYIHYTVCIFLGYAAFKMCGGMK